LFDRRSEIVLVAACHDLLVEDAGQLRERIVVFGSEMIPTNLIDPARVQ